MTDSDYINRAFRPEPGRKYYNHMATHSPGEWHRHWLLTSGLYIKTSERRWKVVGESGPELVNFQGGTRTLHHRGSAIWDPSTGEHYPGCGCA